MKDEIHKTEEEKVPPPLWSRDLNPSHHHDCSNHQDIRYSGRGLSQSALLKLFHFVLISWSRIQNPCIPTSQVRDPTNEYASILWHHHLISCSVWGLI